MKSNRIKKKLIGFVTGEKAFISKAQAVAIGVATISSIAITYHEVFAAHANTYSDFPAHTIHSVHSVHTIHSVHSAHSAHSVHSAHANSPPSVISIDVDET